MGRKHLRRQESRTFTKRKHNCYPTPPPPPSGIRSYRFKTSHRIPSRTIRIASMNVNGLNLQSAIGIETLISEKKIDIFAVSETHFREDIPKERYHLPGFTSFHCDRGGLC